MFSPRNSNIVRKNSEKFNTIPYPEGIKPIYGSIVKIGNLDLATYDIDNKTYVYEKRQVLLTSTQFLSFKENKEKPEINIELKNLKVINSKDENFKQNTIEIKDESENITYYFCMGSKITTNWVNEINSYLQRLKIT
jgi:hypothetical protein